MSLPIRFDSTETGAPVLNNVGGSAIAVFRACLKDGFNVKSVTSITVVSGVATVQCPTHAYGCLAGQLVRISGASVPALGGDHQPTLVDANHFTIPAVGVADGSYTATDARRAPLGFTEEFTDGTKSIFKRIAPEATATMLRVIDTKAAPAATTSAYVSMVSGATGVDTVTGEVTTNGTLWRIGSSSATPQLWVLIGDSLGFYFSGRVTTGPICWFGDPELLYPADADGCFMAASATANNYDALGLSLPTASPTLTAGQISTFFYKSLDGVTLGERARPLGVSTWGQLGMTSPSAVVPLATDLYILTASEIRARMPGVLVPLANQPFADLEVVTFGTRKMLAVNFSVINSSTTGQLLFDMSTPWR